MQLARDCLRLGSCTFVFASFGLIMACAPQRTNESLDLQRSSAIDSAIDPIPASTLSPQQEPEAKPPGSTPPHQQGEVTNYRAALWHQIPTSNTWTDAVVRMVRSRLSDLERARDKSDFCPHYSTANQHSREVCWLRLISAIAKFESDFNPSAMFREPNGAYSVGLMSLSTSECPLAPTTHALKNPVRNLTCGVHIMARLISEDGFIDGPASARGAASYWSTLRAPFINGQYHVGKRDKVIAYTRHYREY